MDDATRLAEIIDRGGPQQAALALQLRNRLEISPDVSPVLRQEIAELFDAYLNDPYLTRQPPE